MLDCVGKVVAKVVSTSGLQHGVSPVPEQQHFLFFAFSTVLLTTRGTQNQGHNNYYTSQEGNHGGRI